MSKVMVQQIGDLNLLQRPEQSYIWERDLVEGNIFYVALRIIEGQELKLVEIGDK